MASNLETVDQPSSINLVLSSEETCWLVRHLKTVGKGNDKAADLDEMVRREIRPAVQDAKLEWKGLLQADVGTETAIAGLTGGNVRSRTGTIAVQAHEHYGCGFYKKETQSALADGVKALDAALKPGSGRCQYDE